MAGRPDDEWEGLRQDLAEVTTTLFAGVASAWGALAGALEDRPDAEARPEPGPGPGPGPGLGPAAEPRPERRERWKSGRAGWRQDVDELSRELSRALSSITEGAGGAEPKAEAGAGAQAEAGPGAEQPWWNDSAMWGTYSDQLRDSRAGSGPATPRASSCSSSQPGDEWEVRAAGALGLPPPHPAEAGPDGGAAAGRPLGRWISALLSSSGSERGYASDSSEGSSFVVVRGPAEAESGDDFEHVPTGPSLPGSSCHSRNSSEASSLFIVGAA